MVEHAAAARVQFVVEADGFGVEASERGRVFEVVEEESRLVRDALERQALDAKARAFGRAVTCGFGGGHTLLGSCRARASFGTSTRSRGIIASASERAQTVRLPRAQPHRAAADAKARATTAGAARARRTPAAARGRVT